MQRRKFVSTIIKGSTISLLAPVFSNCKRSNTMPLDNQTVLPKNWIWIRPDLEWSDDQWKSEFENLKKRGIDAILPQVYNSHTALFEHPLIPFKEAWLERIIPIAHAAELEVHAWMWSMPMNIPSIIEKHPDWFSVNRNGEPSHTHPAYVDYYKFMCPCNEEVQNYVASIVEALGKIEALDGIHLDYIRQPDVILAEALQPKYDIIQDKEYPEYDYPYSVNCRNEFKAQFGIDPIDLGDTAPQHKAWRQFRYDSITNLVNNHCVPMAKKYNKKITAAVFPNWESVRQQWHKWNLDGFLPMLYHGFYNENFHWVSDQVKNNKMLLQKFNNPKPVFPGLFLPHCKASEIPEIIKESKLNGADGVALFALSDFDKEKQSKFIKF